MNPATYLIVEQQQQAPENLPELLKELSQKHQLDIYQCRQRLVGQGLSLLTKGTQEMLAKISAPLEQYGFRHWLVAPSKPKFVPPRIRALEIGLQQVVFSCQKKQVVFPKGANILAVFAEMSGALADKSVKQLLSSHAYRGRDNVRHLEEHKIRKAILQGKPLLDLYLLDEQQQIVDAVRIFPGKFDPKGLGERATISSVQNLDRILKLAEEYAGEFSLVTDFGLVNLPGCALRRENPEDPETERQNLISLARYGWLLADLHRVGPINPEEKETADDLTTAVSAALLMQNPTLAASGQAEDILPVAKEIAKQIEQATTEDSSEEVEPKIAEEGLPAPPPSQKSALWTNPGFWIGSAGSIAAIIVVALLQMGNVDLGHFVHQALSSGTVFVALSILLLWFGFYFIRLKRQVENTPTSKVRSIAMGMVEVKGRALRQYALISPMSHIPCVFYRLTKYRRVNNQWQVSSTSSSASVPFFLEDDTGRVAVDPNGCRVNAGTRQEGKSGLTGLLHNVDDGDEKWVEEVIVEGTLLYVLGFATVKKAAGPSMAGRKIEALRELKRNPQELAQFDRDGDGKIAADEWDQARAAVADKVLREELQKKQQRKKQEEHIVIGKKKGRPLVIAETHSEEKLTQRYAIYSTGLLLLAIGALGWGINNLLNYLK